MNCPSADKLSQYVDELLDEQQHQALKMHINNCENCKRVVKLYENEALFIKETLQNPELPADFDERILMQVDPYPPKRPFWMKPMNIAASSILAFALLAAVTPTIADYVKSIFNTDEVDYGLQAAQRLGFVEELHLSDTNNGITITVDEVMVDTKRIGIVYHATNKYGKPIYPAVWDDERALNYYFESTSGEKIENASFGSSSLNELYGYLEFETPRLTEDLILYWQVDQINGKKGKWHFEIPIPIEKALTYLKPVQLEQTVTVADTEIYLKTMTYTPSSATLEYELKHLKAMPEDIRLKGRGSTTFDMGFIIQDEQGERITSNHIYRNYVDERGIPPLTSSGGSYTEGEWRWEAVFSTITEPKPTLSIIGIEKTTYVTQDITFIPNKLDDSAMLYVEGYPVQITAIHKQLIGEPRVDITLQYDENVPFHFDQWYLVDETGTNYFINGQSATTLTTLKDMDFDQTYTLTLLTTSTFETFDKPIQIPLYE